MIIYEGKQENVRYKTKFVFSHHYKTYLDFNSMK